MSGQLARPLRPALLPAGAVVQRKCACGNKASHDGECDECKGRVQAKLAVGSDHDPAEREADRVADRVIAGHTASPLRASPISVQRLSTTPHAPGGHVPASVGQTVARAGRPLDGPVRRDMESRFGHDFSRVRVHTGDSAAASARDIGAHAYTTGHNIVFGHGQYAPARTEGRRLIAHELTHVLQQSTTGGQPAQVQRKTGGFRVASCGLANLAGDFAQIGSLAHEQVQDYMATKGIGREFYIPRASKTQLGFGCRKNGTLFGRADLYRRSPLGFDLAEIKPVTLAGRTRAKLEIAHYRRRARQSMQRLFPSFGGSCSRWKAGVDDVGFRLQNGFTAPAAFSNLSGVLTGDTPIGPFLGDPSLTLMAKETSPGAVCYWCRKGQQQDQSKPKQPPGPNIGIGLSIGGSSSGAYNAGVGVSIMSDSVAYGTAGAGVSYKSDTKAAGAVGAGSSIESDSVAAGAAGAGSTKDTQSIGAGVAGAGASDDSISAAAGAAGAGTQKESATAGAGVAGHGSVKESAVAGAGGTGSGSMEGVTGAGTGSPGKPVNVKNAEGGGKASPGKPASEGGAGQSEKPKADDAQGKPGDQPSGKEGKAAGETAAGGDQPGTGTSTKPGTPGDKAPGSQSGTKAGEGDGKAGDAKAGAGKAGDSQGGGATGGGGGKESAAEKGKEGARESGPDAGSGTGKDASDGKQAGDGSGKGDATTGGPGTSTGTVPKVGRGLGVMPRVDPRASEADKQKAVEETAKVAALLEKASEAQIELFRQLAQTSPDGQYVVPASDWVNLMMEATAGLSPDDIKYLQTLNWKPSKITAEELRKKILELLKTKKPATTGDGKGSGDDANKAKKAQDNAGGTASGGTGDKKGDKKGQSGGDAKKGVPGLEVDKKLTTARKYDKDIVSTDDTGFEIQPGKAITANTQKGAKVTLEVRWREDGKVKRANVEYEVTSDRQAVLGGTDGKTKLWRFDIRSTNTEKLTLSPEGREHPTVIPPNAPGVYYVYRK